MTGPSVEGTTGAPDAVLELALAAAPAPLSIDALVGWDLARPAELWSFLSGGREAGRLAEPEPGRFAFSAEGDRGDVLARAAPEGWRALLATPQRVGWALEAARTAAADRRFPDASALYRALVVDAPRDAFTGGAAGWLGVVLEGLRLNRGMYGVPRSRYEDALAIAIEHGDVGAQGVLQGSLAAAALRDGEREQAARHLALAREAAEACSGPVAAEIQLYVAIVLVFQGRLRDGIAAFEHVLGDLPDDVGVLVNPRSPAPATPLIVLATAYCGAGQAPRALDLVHRLRVHGVEHGIPLLVHEADLFAAISHEARDEFEAARAHAERAHAFYLGSRTDPLHQWFAATALAGVRAWEGRLDELPAILGAGLEARRRAGWPWLAFPGVLAMLERLELEGGSVPGLSLDDELERIVAGTSVFWKGVAHRYRARRLARAHADPDAVREELERAVALLREAGAGYELEHALADAAGVARGAGRAEVAEALEAERRAAAAMSPASTPPHAGDACARISALLLELGRLGALAARQEGTWGEIAARLCRTLGAERCALVEAGEGMRLLAARGGTPRWREAVLAAVRDRPSRATAVPAPETAGDAAAGQLLLVPFEAEGRSGWACLENRIAAPSVGPGDAELLEVLSAQLGVLLGNLALWQELTSARARLEEENRYWRSTGERTTAGGRMVGDSPALRRTLELVARVAPSSTPVLVTGETGVGKELVATEVHAQSPRRDGPFIAVHVASFTPGLVASGLFGHERGAFTGAVEQAKGRFELADGGTLFLDEIGELGPEDQVRLLRVLQTGTFERVGGARPIRSDFRLVAATHRDLEALVRAGKFREDLYFRLAGFPVHVPPLRERREEIPTLALFFMERASRARGLAFEGIGEADMRRMLEYAWPGNVRELEHVIERAVLLSEPPRLRIPPLDARTRTDAPAPPQRPPALVTLAEVERRHIAEVLRHVRGRITGDAGAAEILGLKPSTLNFRIRKLGLGAGLARSRRRDLGPR